MNSATSLQPTPRDRAALAMVAAYGGVTAEHLFRRFWRTSAYPSACYARVARLVDAGLLRATRMASLTGVGTGKAVLTLDRRGQRLLAVDLGLRPAEIPLSSPLTHPMTAAHHLAMCDVRLALELAVEARDDIELTGWTTETELRRTPIKVTDTYTALGAPARRQITLIADGAFTLATAHREQQGLFEMDRGTTSLPRLQIKLRGYLRWQQHEQIPLFVVTTTEGRVYRIAELVAAQARELRANATLVFITSCQEISETTILAAPIWRQAGIGRPVALLPRFATTETLEKETFP